MAGKTALEEYRKNKIETNTCSTESISIDNIAIALVIAADRIFEGLYRVAKGSAGWDPR